jgi:hypothetical protein
VQDEPVGQDLGDHLHREDGHENSLEFLLEIVKKKMFSLQSRRSFQLFRDDKTLGFCNLIGLETVQASLNFEVTRP